jgi:1-deoxy-D-xylulose-5-phosphate synthase
MPLEDIQSPDDIKKLGLEELSGLSEELRELIIERVSINGGHLSSNLGVIELSIALHYVFDTPHDKIIWDVGHQSYTHKLLTGRYKKFSSLRKFNGISGFPNISESPHDAFGTGHSSTSISAATGIIEARDKKGEHYKVIAVIGDGAMTSGLAFEGLNHAGHLKKDLIVILNDNEMSISKNVGALSAYLTRILTGERFQKFKKTSQAFVENIPKLGGHFSKLAKKAEETIKGLFLPGILFEELGFNYIGPIDGHDIGLLIETLRNVKTSESPTLVHVITKKGKGYEFSEKDPCIFHGVGPFEIETGHPISNGSLDSLTYGDIFAQKLTELAEVNPFIVAITAAMKEGTGLGCFEDKFPDRFYDVGIAEPHAVTFAAGLAIAGMRPVVAIYSTFLQRAYDEIVHDICIQKLPVVFAIDRAGIVGEDGATHQGVFDLSYLRHIPNLTIMAPKDGLELRDMLDLALRLKGPSAIRYPRGRTNSSLSFSALPLHEGEAEILRDGSAIALVALGSTVRHALMASERLEKEGISALVANMRFVKPMDTAMLISIASKVNKIITIEDNVIAGGFGSAVIEALNHMEITDVKIKMLGLPDKFIEHGSQAELMGKYGIDEEGIYNSALSFIGERARKQ